MVQLNESVVPVAQVVSAFNKSCGPIFLCIVISSLFENIFFVLLTIKPLHRICYLRRRRKRFAFLARTRANITSLAFSLQTTVIPFSMQIPVQKTGCDLCDKYSPSPYFPIAHPIAPYHRTRCRNRYLSTESNDHCRFHNLHKFTFYYFCSLCFSIVLLMSVTLMNVFINFGNDNLSLFIADMKYTIQCRYIEICITALMMVMSFSLVQLTTDRLIAVCQPLHYWRIMSSWKCLLLIAVGWLASIVFALVPYIHLRFSTKELPKDNRYCFMVNMMSFSGFCMYAYTYIALVFLLPLGFILCAYVKIHRIVGRSADVHAENHSRYLYQANEDITMSNSMLRPEITPSQCQKCHSRYLDSSYISTRSSISPSSRSRAHLIGNLSSTFPSREGESNKESTQCYNDYLKKARAAKSALVLVSSFYGLILPYICLIGYQAVMTDHVNWNSSLMEAIETTSILLVYLTTIFTPVAYAIRDGALRKRLNYFFRYIKLVCKRKDIPFFS